MNSKSLIVALLLIGAMLTQGARGSVKLSDFLLAYADRDMELSASLLEKEAARADMSLARLSYPTLRLDVTSPSYSWRRSYTYQYYLEDLYRGYLESKDRIYRVALSLREPLPTGGDLSLKINSHRYRTTFAYSGFPSEIPIQRESADREFLADVGIEMEQPILGFLEARERVKTKKLRFSQSDEKTKLDAKRVLRQGIDAFYGFLIAELKLEVAEAKAQLDSALVENAKKQFADSILSYAEVLDRRIDLASARLALEEARANLREARRLLRVSDELVAEDLIPEDLNKVIPIGTSSIEYERHPSVRTAAVDIELARIELAQVRRRRLGNPTLSLWYGFQGLGYDFKEARKEFGRNRWGGTFSIGVTFPEPGFVSDIKRAKAKIKSSQAAYEDAVQDVRQRVDTALKKTNLLRETLALRRKKVDLLETRLGLEHQKHKEGLVSDEELLKFSIEVANARIAYLETLRDLDIAWLEMCCATGRNPIEVLASKKQISGNAK